MNIYKYIYIYSYTGHTYKLDDLSTKKQLFFVNLFFDTLFQPKFRPGRCGFSHCAKPPRILSVSLVQNGKVKVEISIPLIPHYICDLSDGHCFWPRPSVYKYVYTVYIQIIYTMYIHICFLLTLNRWWNHLDKWTPESSHQNWKHINQPGFDQTNLGSWTATSLRFSMCKCDRSAFSSYLGVAWKRVETTQQGQGFSHNYPPSGNSNTCSRESL